MFAILLTSLFAVPLVTASFVEPIVMFEESDARVQCSPAPGQLTCAGLENCKNTDSWWAVDGSDYHGGRMVVTDSHALCRVEFQGTSITFYGLRIENGANGTFAIDGGDRQPFTWGITNERLGGGVTGLFRATGLPFGKHVLEFSVDAVKGTLASVDFFAITDPSLEKDVPQPSRPASFVVPASAPTIPGAPVSPVAPNAAIPNPHNTPNSPLEQLSSNPPTNEDGEGCSPLVAAAAALLAVALGCGALFMVSRRVRRLIRRVRARRASRRAGRESEDDDEDDDKTVVFDMAQEEGKPLLKEGVHV